MEILAYAQPSVLPAALVSPRALGSQWAPGRAVCAPQAHQLPQVHQLRDRVELILAVAPNGVDGTSGFTGNGVDGATKRMAVRGVPPRGRPV
ncbi:hypothetical protein V6U90_06830 [Micromonospora sp. CPCC 206060]|uniref:hypothetical protein n=1 Tax=Micromonospora sp. CPCC 206060 TaxID=3122406 RepID=UPI002FEFC1A1